MYEIITLGTPPASHREPWGTIGKSKEALDAAQWERMQTGRVSEHFWAKSDYVRRRATPPSTAHKAAILNFVRKNLFSIVSPMISQKRMCDESAAPISQIGHWPAADFGPKTWNFLEFLIL